MELFQINSSTKWCISTHQNLRLNLCQRRFSPKATSPNQRSAARSFQLLCSPLASCIQLPHPKHILHNSSSSGESPQSASSPATTRFVLSFYSLNKLNAAEREGPFQIFSCSFPSLGLHKTHLSLPFKSREMYPVLSPQFLSSNAPQPSKKRGDERQQKSKRRISLDRIT